MTVTDDGSHKPWGSGWSAACVGTLVAYGSNDPGSVVAQGGQDTGGDCGALSL